MTKTLCLRKPDDFHLHLRDNTFLVRTVPDAAKQFGRAIIMPNLTPPITTVDAALAYRKRILSHISNKRSFQPLMTLYLTDNTSIKEIQHASANEHIFAAKLYPAGATTNSDFGVTDIKHIFSVLAEMEKQQFPLLIHGETTQETVDIFDREAVFIDETLTKIIHHFPQLPIVFEHITTKQAVDFVLAQSVNVAATITPHHLLYNRNHLLVGGIKPHFYCLPILKRNLHQHALQKAAISGNPKFFLGTDSAPHSQSRKESACGCAGIYSAYNAIEIYASIFEQLNALDKLNDFSSVFGAQFYKLGLNEEMITLERTPQIIPDKLSFGEEYLIPLMAGESLNWQLKLI